MGTKARWRSHFRPPLVIAGSVGDQAFLSEGGLNYFAELFIGPARVPIARAMGCADFGPDPLARNDVLAMDHLLGGHQARNAHQPFYLLRAREGEESLGRGRIAGA